MANITPNIALSKKIFVNEISNTWADTAPQIMDMCDQVVTIVVEAGWKAPVETNDEKREKLAETLAKAIWPDLTWAEIKSHFVPEKFYKIADTVIADGWDI